MMSADESRVSGAIDASRSMLLGKPAHSRVDGWHVPLHNTLGSFA